MHSPSGGADGLVLVCVVVLVVVVFGALVLRPRRRGDGIAAVATIAPAFAALSVTGGAPLWVLFAVTVPSLLLLGGVRLREAFAQELFEGAQPPPLFVDRSNVPCICEAEHRPGRCPDALAIFAPEETGSG